MARLRRDAPRRRRVLELPRKLARHDVRDWLTPSEVQSFGDSAGAAMVTRRGRARIDFAFTHGLFIRELDDLPVARSIDTRRKDHR